MAKVECNPFFSSASNQSPRQEQLFLLISQLCAPRSVIRSLTCVV